MNTVPQKQCPVCGRVNAMDAPACPCGHPFRTTFTVGSPPPIGSAAGTYGSDPLPPGPIPPGYAGAYGPPPGASTFSSNTPPGNSYAAGPGYAAPHGGSQVGGYGPGGTVTGPVGGLPQSAHMELVDLALRHQEANKIMLFSGIGGFFFPLVWILTFIEYQKMQDLKSQVRARGVDVEWWTFNYPVNYRF